MIQAGGSSANLADKMDMIIVVMTTCTIFPAQSIPCCIVCSGDGMNYPLIDECLQCSVNRYPVETFPRDLLNIIMGKRIVRLQKNFEYGSP